MKALYSVLVADPPWSFGDKLPGQKRGAARNYRVLTVEQIKAFPLPPLADDALLFLWRVSAMQEEALAVMRAWGFVPKSELVWLKSKHSGPPILNEKELPDDGMARAFKDGRQLEFGMGRYTRMQHEVCLIGRRGKARVRDHGVRSVFFAPRRAHSQKPDEFYGLVERLHAGPYVELFARARREGWDARGDELPVRVRGTFRGAALPLPR